MVKDVNSFYSLINQFDPKNSNQLHLLKSLLEENPNFQFLRAYYLKSVQKQDPKNFDKALSHTAIATYDRKLLYEFIEVNNKQKSIGESKIIKKIKISLPEENQPQVKESQKNTINSDKKKSPSLQENMSFSEWARYFKTNKKTISDQDISKKLELIDSFLAKKEKIIPDKTIKNKEDLSEKSWTNTDELMTETLAKVFVKQKKYVEALEAYSILGLKYPEKNSFFADQIKKIKKLHKKQRLD